MSKLLIVVDMQNDFINGSLGTNEAVAIVPKVIEKIKNHDGKVIFTRDTHDDNYFSTQEGRHLPVLHCVKDTNGWQLNSLIEECVGKNSIIINKPSFGSLQLVEEITKLKDKEKYEQIELIGLCTDICVISNAFILKAAFPECTIVVDSNCCAGVTKESHQNALKAMKMCQVFVIE